jgi:hypothetical protein
MKAARKPASRAGDSRKEAAQDAAAPVRRRGSDGAARKRRSGDGPARDSRPGAGTRTRRPHEPRGPRPGPQTAPTPRPADRTARAKTTSQAKARAKARKAKAPKVVRPPLRERLLARLATLELRPQALLARIPFVVLVIGSLAIGLAITLWLSTDAAQRSYQLGNARELNDALTQQKEALERDVLEAQSAPALADAARELGMIPSKDTAHLVQDPGGNWVVIGQPKPAEGVPPPPLNTKLPELLPPDPKPAAPKPPPAPSLLAPGVTGEVPVRLPPSLAGRLPGSDLEVPALLPSVTDANQHAPLGGPAPLPGAPLGGPAPLPGAPLGGPALLPGAPPPGPAPLPGAALPGPQTLPSLPPPLGDTLVIPPATAVGAPVPTVALVPPVTDVASEVAPVGVAH